ncbi:MAG: hypothetical protein AAB091_00680, partial [Elusimicrobiota bacterium]
MSQARKACSLKRSGGPLPSDKSRLAVWAVFLASAALAGRCYFAHLTWGAPSPERTRAVMGSLEELKRWAPRMLELRQTYYRALENLLDPAKTFKDNYDKAYNRHRFEPWATLPRDAVLDQMRAFLLGVMNSDEQNTLTSLTQLKNILKPGFIPGFATFYYGGSYLFLCGAVLKAASLAGVFHLTGDVGYYLFHPEQIRAMYWLARAMGPATLFISAVFLWIFMKRRFGLGLACLATTFYLFTPGLVYYAHLAKPHVYAASLMAIGLFWCLKILDQPVKKNYLMAGLFLGLSAGALITNLPVLALLVLAEALREDWNWRRVVSSRLMWMGLGIALLAYFVTNFHFYIYFRHFLRSIRTWDEYGAGYGHFLWGNIPPYLKDIWTMQIHWLFLPCLIFGMVTAFQRKDKGGILCVFGWALLFVLDLILTRHWGVNLRTIPFFTIFFALALERLWSLRGGFIPKLVLASAALGLLLDAGQCHFYSFLFKSPMNVEKASVWAQNNLPRGSSVGIFSGTFGPISMPAFRFLDHRLVNIPDQPAEVFWKESDLPEY